MLGTWCEAWVVEGSALSARPLSAQAFDLTAVWHCVDQWNAMQSDFSETVNLQNCALMWLVLQKHFQGFQTVSCHHIPMCVSSQQCRTTSQLYSLTSQLCSLTSQLCNLFGGSGGVVNSLDFYLALLKSLGHFYFWCLLSSQCKAVIVNLQSLRCQL